MPRLRTTLGFVAILVPTLAIAGPAPIRLIAPATGIALRGGETAEVAWDADALPVAAEEWEAFLSIDGGQRYAIRITPHLDIRLHRASFAVPNITTGDARLLFRFGNEQRETEVELPASFAIEGTFDGTPVWPSASVSATPGEEARRGDGGVAAWVAGSRDGRGSHLVTASIPESMRGQSVCAGAGADSQSAAMQRTPLAAAPDQSPLSFRLTHQRLPSRSKKAAFTDVLLVSGRLNI
jgi:hypothetical protein